jgi:hypothetical protein
VDFRVRKRTLDSQTDKITLSLTAFADELEREKAQRRTYDELGNAPMTPWFGKRGRATALSEEATVG